MLFPLNLNLFLEFKLIPRLINRYLEDKDDELDIALHSGDLAITQCLATRDRSLQADRPFKSKTTIAVQFN